MKSNVNDPIHNEFLDLLEYFDTIDCKVSYTISKSQSGKEVWDIRFVYHYDKPIHIDYIYWTGDHNGKSYIIKYDEERKKVQGPLWDKIDSSSFMDWVFACIEREKFWISKL